MLPTLWCGLVLLAASLAAWFQAGRTGGFIRLHLRFAAALFAAPAVALIAAIPQLGMAALLMASSLGAAALGIGMFASLSRPVPPAIAAIALVLALGFGLAATVTGQVLYAIVPVILGASVFLPFALTRFLPLVLGGAAMLVFGGMALLDGAINAAALFFAAAIPALTRGAAKL